MKKPYIFYSDLYKENFLFMPGYTQKQINSLFKKLKIEDPPKVENCEGTTDFYDGFIVIWSKHKDKSQESILNLVHESVHAANLILDFKGIPISLENDETQAYLIEWIFENCYKVLK
jgi:hypothetical protein